MANNFRDNSPSRTYTGTYADYRSYKLHLAKDFNNRCGYTNCPDFWFGGRNNFHIDHFIPWKNYPHKPELKTNYANLVYACSYVNILKSNDEGPYIDPCDNDFNKYFSRDNSGRIVPVTTSKEAIYMYKKLKLYMLRYQIIWVLDRLYTKMRQIKEAIGISSDDDRKKSLLLVQGQLANMMVDYLTYLEKTQ